MELVISFHENETSIRKYKTLLLFLDEHTNFWLSCSRIMRKPVFSWCGLYNVILLSKPKYNLELEFFHSHRNEQNLFFITPTRNQINMFTTKSQTYYQQTLKFLI